MQRPRFSKPQGHLVKEPLAVGFKVSLVHTNHHRRGLNHAIGLGALF